MTSGRNCSISLSKTSNVQSYHILKMWIHMHTDVWIHACPHIIEWLLSALFQLIWTQWDHTVKEKVCYWVSCTLFWVLLCFQLYWSLIRSHLCQIAPSPHKCIWELKIKWKWQDMSAFIIPQETIIKLLKALTKCLFFINCMPVLIKDPKLFWNGLSISCPIPLPYQYRHGVLGYTVTQQIKDKA